MPTDRNVHHGPIITSGTGLCKAVCHKCDYVGFEPNTSTCGTCGFPLLLEPYDSDQLMLPEIFERPLAVLAVHLNAPPLPGVDGRPRQAQLRAEARRRRRLSTVPPPAPTPAATVPAAESWVRRLFGVRLRLRVATAAVSVGAFIAQSGL